MLTRKTLRVQAMRAVIVKEQEQTEIKKRDSTQLRLGNYDLRLGQLRLVNYDSANYDSVIYDSSQLRLDQLRLDQLRLLSNTTRSITTRIFKE